MNLTCMSHSTSWTNGGNTNWSRTFLITSTANGGLYHVSRWLAGSCICLSTKITNSIENISRRSVRRCQIHLHDHRWVFHDASTWPKLLERRWSIQAARTPANETKRKTHCIIIYSYWMDSVFKNHSFLRMRKNFISQLIHFLNHNLRTRCDGSTFFASPLPFGIASNSKKFPLKFFTRSIECIIWFSKEKRLECGKKWMRQRNLIKYTLIMSKRIKISHM